MIESVHDTLNFNIALSRNDRGIIIIAQYEVYNCIASNYT